MESKRKGEKTRRGEDKNGVGGAVCFARAAGNEAPPIKGGVTIGTLESEKRDWQRNGNRARRPCNAIRIDIALIACLTDCAFAVLAGGSSMTQPHSPSIFFQISFFLFSIARSRLFSSVKRRRSVEVGLPRTSNERTKQRDAWIIGEKERRIAKARA